MYDKPRAPAPEKNHSTRTERLNKKFKYFYIFVVNLFETLKINCTQMLYQIVIRLQQMI